jgi:hypothetical protein
LAQLSSTLAGVANAVERLPGMKSGEDPATHIVRSKSTGWGAIAFAAIAAASVGMILISQRRRAQV